MSRRDCTIRFSYSQRDVEDWSEILYLGLTLFVFVIVCGFWSPDIVKDFPLLPLYIALGIFGFFVVSLGIPVFYRSEITIVPGEYCPFCDPDNESTEDILLENSSSDGGVSNNVEIGHQGSSFSPVGRSRRYFQAGLELWNRLIAAGTVWSFRSIPGKGTLRRLSSSSLRFLRLDGYRSYPCSTPPGFTYSEGRLEAEINPWKRDEMAEAVLTIGRGSVREVSSSIFAPRLDGHSQLFPEFDASRFGVEGEIIYSRTFTNSDKL